MIYFLIINVINNLLPVYYLGNKFAFFSNKKSFCLFFFALIFRRRNFLMNMWLSSVHILNIFHGL